MDDCLARLDGWLNGWMDAWLAGCLAGRMAGWLGIKARRRGLADGGGA